MTAEYYIEKLHLESHPEGGYYKETYRCAQNIRTDFSTDERSISTAIYFLLRDQEVSHFHKIKSDELWFFHDGDSLEILVMENDKLNCFTLGKNIEAGEQLQLVVPANCWFASRIKGRKGFALVSCTVAPGFDFRDFELAKLDSMIAAYPKYESDWKELCID